MPSETTCFSVLVKVIDGHPLRILYYYMGPPQNNFPLYRPFISEISLRRGKALSFLEKAQPHFKCQISSILSQSLRRVTERS